MQSSRNGGPARVGAVRWPCRVIAVASAGGPLTWASSETLINHGIDLHPYDDGTAALLGLITEDPGAVFAPTDLIGVDFVRFVKAIMAWSPIPIIVGLTTDPASHDHAFAALEAGARGLLPVPFDPDQLVAAIKQAGLTNTAPAGRITYGAIEVDRAAVQVRLAGTLVYLTPREFRLVDYLVGEAPRVVSVAEVAAVISDADNLADGARVRTYVKNVRQRFAVGRRGQPSVIETVRGVGYRIVEL